MAQNTEPTLIKPASNILIAYSGKKLGNLSEKYSPAADVEQNRKRLFAPFKGKHLVLMDTNAGIDIAHLDSLEFGRLPAWVKGDGFITSRTDIVIGLFAGDCLPAVLYIPGHPLLAFMHIATSNAALEFPAKMLRLLKNEYQADPADLKCYIGPSVKKKSYRFESIEEKKLDGSWEPYITNETDGWHIDLPGYVLNEFTQNGMNPKNIEINKIDTGGDPHYYSHRRSRLTGEPEGRNGFAVALI